VTFTYTPTAGYRGPDEFTLRASDGTHTVDQVIRVTVVDPVDNPPQCFAALQGAPPVPGAPLEVEAGVPASGSMSCSDDEGENLAFSVADGPDHGTLSALNEFPGGPGFESAFFTYTPAAAYRGPDEFTLRASDGTNQVETTIQVTVVDPVDEDTTAPDTTITGGPTQTTDDATPTFTFSSSEPGSTFECRVNTGAFAACTSPHTTATLADGAHTFQVRAKDPSGNTDQSPASRSFTVATAATGGGSAGGAGGGTGGGSGDTGGGSTPTPAVPCQGLTGSGKAKCQLDLRIKKKCGALKGKKKGLCAKRERALAKCNALKSKTPAQKAKKKACLRKAKKIGANKKP
jgi:Bacterial Ig-like domain/Bacterial Ig domain